MVISGVYPNDYCAVRPDEMAGISPVLILKMCMTSQGHPPFDESGICHFHAKCESYFHGKEKVCESRLCYCGGGALCVRDNDTDIEPTQRDQRERRDKSFCNSRFNGRGIPEVVKIGGAGKWNTRY